MDFLADARARIADANPDLLPSEYTSSRGSGNTEPAIGAESKTHDLLRQRYKCLKLQFSGEESKHLFHQHCLNSESWDCNRNGSAEMDRKAAKDEIKQIKNKKEREGDLQESLSREIAENTARSQQAYERCQRDAQEAERRRGQDSGGIECASSVKGRSDRKADADAQRDAENINTCTQRQKDHAADKKRLAEELWRIRERRSALQREGDELQRQDVREREDLRKKQDVQDLGMKVEVPDICFPSRGKVVIGGKGSKANNMPEEAIRTIEISHDDDGKLIHAKPHAKLNLDQAVARALEQDDIGILLKHATDKVYEMTQSTRAGGA